MDDVPCELDVAVPGDHPGPLPQPAPQRAAGAVRAEVHHVNPTCGDEVTLRVHLDGRRRRAVVADVSYDARGLLDQPGRRRRC